MTKSFIKTRLERLEQNRLIGKPGLSMNEIRDSQVKVRFTENESDLLTLVSQKMGQPKAVISNVLMMDAIIDLLASDDQLCEEVMQAWAEDKRPTLDFFSEINARATETRDFFDGECRRVESRRVDDIARLQMAKGE
ncbi:hypothetical protein [Enterovibrio sp. 27052020O]|uniref:hypothetical protein n=1 Tax=Enterovibrio sp. 27052020O TaxID=3241166 RepID=UPI00388E01C4